MKRAAALFIATAGVVAVVDLGHKATARGEAVHARSATYVVVIGLLLAVLAAAIVATRSGPLAGAGGIAAGAALGNAASTLLWGGVPNPIAAGALAFNLADAFVLVGFVLLALTTLAIAVRERDRLREPVRIR